MRQLRYTTRSGIGVTRTLSRIPYRRGLRSLLRELDRRRGIYLSSGYEYPERYSRWDVAALNPPLEIVARGREVEFRALNERGAALARMLGAVLAPHPHWERLEARPGALHGTLKPLPALFPEEERSKQPSVFSILRALVEEFRHAKDSRLVLAGAFGNHLMLQVDPIRLKQPRGEQRGPHLFVCDDNHLMDRKREVIERYQYEFSFEDYSTMGLARETEDVPSQAAPPDAAPGITADHEPGEYMAKVETVRRGGKAGG